jgi:hypothetical protein
MKATSMVRSTMGKVLAVLLLAGAGLPGDLAPPGVRAQATASPRSTDVEASKLGEMLGRLPDRPLGLDGAMVTYADVALQTTSLSVTPSRDAGDQEGLQQWMAAVMPLNLPQSTGRHWSLPEWREAFGFDLFQVEQAVEYAAPPFGLTVLRGSFDPAELRAAWARGGYRPIDLGAGEAYAVREDYEIAFSDPGSRMALSYLNVVALSDDGTLVLGSTRDGVRGALAAAAGTAPTFAERADVASMVRAAPPNLVSALLVDGELLHTLPDPAEAFLGDESLEDFATRAATEQTEARRLPPVAAVLLGQMAGAIAAGNGMATPSSPPALPVRLVVILATIGPEAAQTAATVIAERLARQRTPLMMTREMTARPWAELFPEREVRAVPGESAVLIELVSAAGVSPFILQDMLFQRTPGFLAWEP